MNECVFLSIHSLWCGKTPKPIDQRRHQHKNTGRTPIIGLYAKRQEA